MTKIVNSWNDFAPLKRVIVGRADFSVIPPEEPATSEKVPIDSEMRGMWGPRPTATVEAANEQLDNYVKILEGLGVKVDRPTPLQWNQAIQTPDFRTESGFTQMPPRDILLTIMAPDMVTLTTLIIDWIGGIEGVYGTRSSLVTNVIVGAESWRANILTQRQVNQAIPQRTPDRTQAGLDAADLALAQALARDGRASVASLSQELDMPTSTVHRRMRRLLANQNIIMRCDAAPELAGWQLECTWLTTVAFNYKNRVIELLKEQPSLRSCFWITGSNNLRVNFRVNHIGSMAALESSIASAIPGLAPDETVVHMRSHKSMGWLLKPDGSCTGQLVPPVFGP